MPEIMFPVGRMVGGSCDEMFQRKNDDGSKKFMDDGVTPSMQASIGVAYAKDPAFPHWSQTPWGQKIMAVGAADYPEAYQHQDFAWKVTDGDAKQGKKPGSKAPCTLAGHPGHWVIWFSQNWLPKLCNADGSQTLTTPGSIVPGYFVQVLAEVVGNKDKNGKPSKSPGVYMNPKAVALAGYGEKIISAAEVDTKKAGFGGAALPPGATTVPVGVLVAPAPAALVGIAPPVAAAALPAIPATVVTPNAAYMAPPPAAVAPPPVSPPPAGPRIMTKTATGEKGAYDAMVAIGWTDALFASEGWVG